MGSLIRLIVGVPGAIIVTVGLFLLMNFLIQQNAELEEERDIIKIDINAKVPDVDLDEVDDPAQPPAVGGVLLEVDGSADADRKRAQGDDEDDENGADERGIDARLRGRP